MALDAGAAIAKEYDATLPTRNISSRTSYVIAKNGTVASAYSAMDPNDHVNQTLAALKTLNGKK
jgi:peroxiredoxin